MSIYPPILLNHDHHKMPPSMKLSYTLITFFLLFGIISCEVEGGIEEFELTLETLPFDRITLESSSDIQIIQSDEHRVIIRGRKRDVDRIEVRVIDDRLTIEENGNHPDYLLIKCLYQR